MKKINDGGPVFPNNYSEVPGMTRRQWLAGMAMQAIVSTPTQYTYEGLDGMARIAYERADAMLAFEENEATATPANSTQPTQEAR